RRWSGSALRIDGYPRSDGPRQRARAAPERRRGARRRPGRHGRARRARSARQARHAPRGARAPPGRAPGHGRPPRGTAGRAHPMSAAPPELVALRERAAVLCDLDRIGALLFWDQNTMMPPNGATARGDHAATLQTVAHERITDPGLVRQLDVLEPWAAGEDPDADDVRLIRELRRDVEKAIRVPTSLAAEMS